MDKKNSRLRRARRGRAKIKELKIPRLSIFRTPRHMYAQVIAPSGSEVMVSASTIDKGVKSALEGVSGNIAAALVVGRVLAERAREAGIPPCW